MMSAADAAGTDTTAAANNATAVPSTALRTRDMALLPGLQSPADATPSENACQPAVLSRLFCGYAMARMATQAGSLRQVRERELVLATRALFDERGMQHAPIEEIAKAVGIARGLVYRQFSSKEELFVLTVTEYLSELDGVLAAAIDDDAEPAAQLEQWARAYAGFCLA